ncbi:MAG: hypothetical protein HDT16_03525 [Oscillibacter sp.]|nr:hypothetical protein [Oscillibacter sp.]
MEGKRPPGVMLYFAEMRPIFALLTAEERGDLLLKIFDYAELGVEPVLDSRLSSIWPYVRKQIDLDAASYQAKCDQRRKAVQARWDHARAEKEKPG